MTIPEIFRFEAPPAENIPGKVALSVRSKHNYWTANRYVTKARKWAYIGLPFTSYENGAAHLTEMVFRIPVALADQITENDLLSWQVEVTEVCRPFEGTRNHARIVKYTAWGEPVLVELGE